MNRRKLLKVGAGLGAGAGLALYGRSRLLPPAPSSPLEDVDVLARRFCESLDAEQQAACCVAYDHPLRQYHNRGVWGGGLGIFRGFDRAQRALLTDLFHAGLSAEGRRRVPEEYYTRWPGVHGMNVLVCGDPHAPPYQLILTGAHLNLRIGGQSREGVAFGGPQVYGDQRGDGRAGLPGNLYRDQHLLAQRLLRALDEGQRRAATLERAPIQTQVELMGRSGTPPGLPTSELEGESRALVGALVESILSIYPERDVACARECLAANGGLEALAFSTYARDEDGPVPEAQIFRLEGPAAVFHFRGHPHVHAFVNVAMDGDAPLSVGELLGENPAALDEEGVRALLERTLRSQLDCPLADYPPERVVGRLRAGPIRSGDIYVMESWRESAAIVEVRGADLSDGLRAQLRARGELLESERIYRVASSASDSGSRIGRARSSRLGPPLRELVVEHVRLHGFRDRLPGKG